MDIPTVRIGFVSGVEPDRFARRWRSAPRAARLELVPLEWSQQEEALISGDVDMCFARRPVRLDIPVHAVPLWEELPVVVVSTDSILSLHEDLGIEDLEDSVEIPAQSLDDAKDRIAVVATGVGHAIMPMSVARRHHRKDVVHRVLRDHPSTTIALTWPVSSDDALRQDIVGVVRGRTARSSRGEDTAEATAGSGVGARRLGAETTGRGRGQSPSQRKPGASSTGKGAGKGTTKGTGKGRGLTRERGSRS